MQIWISFPWRCIKGINGHIWPVVGNPNTRFYQILQSLALNIKNKKSLDSLNVECWPGRLDAHQHCNAKYWYLYQDTFRNPGCEKPIELQIRDGKVNANVGRFIAKYFKELVEYRRGKKFVLVAWLQLKYWFWTHTWPAKNLSAVSVICIGFSSPLLCF